MFSWSNLVHGRLDNTVLYCSWTHQGTLAVKVHRNAETNWKGACWEPGTRNRTSKCKGCTQASAKDPIVTNHKTYHWSIENKHKGTQKIVHQPVLNISQKCHKQYHTQLCTKSPTLHTSIPALIMDRREYIRVSDSEIHTGTSLIN